MLNPKKIPNVIILVEGENEEGYWRAMRYLGRAKKFNLWHATDAKLNSLLRTIKGDEQIVIIADTDQVSAINNFIHSVSRIKKHCTLTPLIILQYKNFEDELCYSCTCTINDLYKHFNATGLTNLKTNINQEKQLSKKLDGINHQKSLMWSRSIQDMPIKFSNIGNLIGDYDVLMDKNIITN